MRSIFTEQLETVPQSHLPSSVYEKERDGVKLLVLDRTNGTVSSDSFSSLADYLRSGDLLVVNNSKLVKAELSAYFPGIEEYGYIHFGTSWEGNLVLVEPRPKHLNMKIGELEEVDLVGPQRSLRLVRRHDLFSRYWWADTGMTREEMHKTMEKYGRPITYDHVSFPVPLEYYNTPFSKIPGSVEPPSAGFPFTGKTVERLRQNGIEIAEITLHCNLGSLESHEFDSRVNLLDEEYSIPVSTLRKIDGVRKRGGRIVAVGTTVVRSLETCFSGKERCLGSAETVVGKSELFIRRGFDFKVVDALITGMHDGDSSHIDMISALVGPELLETAYGLAVEWGYLWHEFGDITLIL